MTVALVVTFLLAVVPIITLYAFDVPLGEPGKFVYRYTPILGARLTSALAVLPALALVLAALAALADGRAVMRRAGYALGAFSLACLVAWNFWAPPEFMAQHYFNFRSPSHDGAFLNEAEKVRSIPIYLHHFDQHIQASKESFGGTRVIANPPLTTVLFRGVLWAFPSSAIAPGTVEGWFIRGYNMPPDMAIGPAAAMKAALTCALMVFLAGIVAMAWGRMFLLPVGAFAFAVIVTLNPMTVHFNPGKDPAQLLTVNLMLWAWFAGYRRRNWLLHAIAGGLLTVGMGIGLIHLWVAIAALVATGWHALFPSPVYSTGEGNGGAASMGEGQPAAGPHPNPLPWHTRERGQDFLLRHVVPTIAGAVLVWLAIWLAFDWNLAGTVVAVSRRWKQLQPEINYNYGLWLLIGLPSLLAFVGPAIWLLIASSLRWRWIPKTLGGRLAIATCGVMTLVYFIGIPYELPRLWVVFLPSLVLGLLMTQPLARGRTHKRATVLILLVIGLHVIGTAIHWSMLDVRESEYRLKTGRLFN